MQVTGRSLNDIFAIKYFPLPFVVGAKAQGRFNN